MSSVRQIAKQAGVSITTVSRVLNNHPRVSAAARDKVLTAANKARYRPTVGRKSTINIALVYTGTLAVGSPFDAAMMDGMAAGMEEFGYDLMVLDGKRVRHPGETYTQMFMRKGIRGAVLRSSMTARSVAREIADEGFPAVVLGDRFEHPTMTFAGIDSTDASRAAVQHLIDLGHRHIGVVTNLEDDCDHLDRIGAFHQAMAEAGLPHDESRVYRTWAHREGGETFANHFVTMPDRPTALYFLDPVSAHSALNRIQTLGLRVPEDLSAIGFDDDEWRFLARPQMTAVCQNVVALGQSAFSALNQLIEHPNKKPTLATTPAWLEVHRSTGPVPA